MIATSDDEWRQDMISFDKAAVAGIWPLKFGKRPRGERVDLGSKYPESSYIRIKESSTIAFESIETTLHHP